jgi:hypothetical protein
MLLSDEEIDWDKERWVENMGYKRMVDKTEIIR